LPAISCAREFTPAARYSTPGTLRSACASSTVSVVAIPPPWRTPPCEKLPAITVIMLVPAALTCASMVLWAPLPSATIVMTAPTPMIIPSIVSIVRILFRESAFNAITRVMSMDMLCSL
jgi:hypothetical protein